jgi:hypothetical protein
MFPYQFPSSLQHTLNYNGIRWSHSCLPRALSELHRNVQQRVCHATDVISCGLARSLTRYRTHACSAGWCCAIGSLRSFRLQPRRIKIPLRITRCLFEHRLNMKSLKWIGFLTLVSCFLVIGCGRGSDAPDQDSIAAYVAAHPFTAESQKPEPAK